MASLSNKSGFGLIELMVSVLIVGILAAIAIPSYISHVEKTKTNTAITDIYAIQTCLERFYTINSQYPDQLSEVSTCLPHSGLDPWGNAYAYLNIINGDPGKGKCRKDHKLNPINTMTFTAWVRMVFQNYK